MTIQLNPNNQAGHVGATQGGGDTKGPTAQEIIANALLLQGLAKISDELSKSQSEAAAKDAAQTDESIQAARAQGSFERASQQAGASESANSSSSSSGGDLAGGALGAGAMAAG